MFTVDLLNGRELSITHIKYQITYIIFMQFYLQYRYLFPYPMVRGHICAGHSKFFEALMYDEK